MSEPNKSLNHQLSDAISSLAVAGDRLAITRGALERARREESEAVNKVNEEQKRFDDLVATVKKSAPRETNWKRSPGSKP